jgi:hypothetical protein
MVLKNQRPVCSSLHSLFSFCLFSLAGSLSSRVRVRVVVGSKFLLSGRAHRGSHPPALPHAAPPRGPARRLPLSHTRSGGAGSTASPTLRGTWAGALALAQPRQVQREREPAPHPPSHSLPPRGRTLKRRGPTRARGVTATESVASAPDPGRAIPFPGRARARTHATQQCKPSDQVKRALLCFACLTK